MIRYNEDNNKQMNEWIWNRISVKQWTDNSIGTKGMKKITESLKTNTTLTKLIAYGYEKINQDNDKQTKEWNEIHIQLKWTANNIGAEGAKAISELLKNNTTLTKLSLMSDD